MTTRTILPALLAALLLAAQAAGAATAPDDDDEPKAGPDDSRWSLALDTDVDQQSTRAFAGSVGYRLSPVTGVRVGAVSTDFGATHNAGFKAQGIEAGLRHDFRRFEADAALAHWEATDILSATELKLGGDYLAGAFRGGLRAGYRRSTFEPIATTVTAGTGPAVDAVARCVLTNEAFGADARWQGSVWGAHATLMSYHYAQTACDVTGSDGSFVRVRQTRGQFSTLAAALVDPLSVAAVRYLGRDQSLLDSSLDSGVSWKRDDFAVSLNYARQRDYFLGVSSSTYFVTGTADLGGGTGVDCTVGLTRGGGVTDGGFVGFAVRAKF